MRGRLQWTVALGLLTSLLGWWGLGFLRASSVLLNTMGLPDPSGLTNLVVTTVDVKEAELPLAEGAIAVRIYTPQRHETTQGILLVHGIHPDGYRTPRLVAFARALASVGYRVMTPSLPELASLEATPQSVTRISHAGKALAHQVRGPIEAIGISVGGGLCLLAAAQQSDQYPIRKVTTIGAHHDLERVALYYAGKPAADPSGRENAIPPHPYGIRVLAHAHAEHLFAAQDVEVARTILASNIDQVVPRDELPLRKLTKPGRELMIGLLDNPSAPAVQERLRAAIAEVAPRLHAVSPSGQLANLKTPVMLLHGSRDPTIPATEMAWLAKEVPEGLLIEQELSPVLVHAELPKGAPIGDFLRLLHFVSDMLPPR